MAEEDKSQSRVLILCDDVDRNSVRPIIQKIYEFNEEDAKIEAVMNENSFQREIITIVINSYGGYIDDMFALISAMEESDTPIHTHVGGIAMSAGAKILMAGHIRTASKYATIMVHDLAGGIYGHREDVNAQLKQMEIMRKRVMNFIEGHSKLTHEFLEDMMAGRKDIYFTAEEAFEAGIIDGIHGVSMKEEEGIEE